MTITTEEVYVLNTMNSKAAKVQLGTKISDAETVVAAEIALATGSILIGNGSNVAAAAAVSGDITISSAGVAAIAAGALVNADVNAAAAISGSKIAPDFGAQNIITTGTLAAGATTISGDLSTSKSASSDVGITIDNTSAVSATADANLVVRTASGGGDPYTRYIATGTNTWSTGIDRSDSGAYKIARGSGLSSNVSLEIDTSLNVTWTLGGGSSFTIDAGTTPSLIDYLGAVVGSPVTSRVYNFDNTSGTSDAIMRVQVGGASGGDPKFTLVIDAATTWSLGTDNSDSDTFKIGPNVLVGSSSALGIQTTGYVLAYNGLTVGTTAHNNSIGIRCTGTTLLNGVSQYGIYSDPAFTSAALSEGMTFYSQVQTNAAAFTMPSASGYYVHNANLGAGSAVTRLVNYRGIAQTAGTNNAFIADNVTFTGNFFIHQSGSQASQFGGILNCSAGITTKVSIANTSNPPTNAEVVSAFGAAATVGSGFIGIIDDNDAHTNEYLIFSDGTKFWQITATACA